LNGINIDKTAPTVNANASPGPNGNGWNNTNVTVTFSGSDGLSGIATCDSAVPLTNEGAGQTATGSCTDRAGNSASAAVSGINIDKTAPTLNPVVTPIPVLLNGSATASAGATDNLSGIDSHGCDTPVTNSVGPHTVACAAMDRAGNTANGNGSYTVQYATGVSCYGAPGHTILQPIDADGSSVFKWKSIVPAKFRVCDANGAPIGTPGVVTSFKLVQKISGAVTSVDEDVVSTTPDTAFRWSSTDQQWIFNMNSKNLLANYIYVYRITLNDLTTIDFQFGLK
jgi:hypothetical protein